MTIETSNICSHLQKKLFEEDGIYHPLLIAMQDDPELTAVVRSRQLHIYRNGKKVLVMARRCWYWQERQFQKSSGKTNLVLIFPLYEYSLFQLIVYLIRHSL